MVCDATLNDSAEITWSLSYSLLVTAALQRSSDHTVFLITFEAPSRPSKDVDEPGKLAVSIDASKFVFGEKQAGANPRSRSIIATRTPGRLSGNITSSFPNQFRFARLCPTSYALYSKPAINGNTIEFAGPARPIRRPFRFRFEFRQ